VDLKLTITLIDELEDEVVRSTGELDLASGEIRNVKYIDYDIEAEGPPVHRDDYDFTSGLLANGDREVEFGVQVDVMSGKYSVTPTELLEIKGRAARLFSGAGTGQPDVPMVTPRKKR
jgi:hypothetical protein